MIDLYSIGRAIAALDGRGVGDDFTSVAEEIQRSLLDIHIANEPGIETGVRAAPGRLAGGDYVDAIVRPGAPTVFAIGDVSGKSLPSALKALSLKFAIRALLTVDPAGLCRALEVANSVMGEVVTPEDTFRRYFAEYPRASTGCSMRAPDTTRRSCTGRGPARSTNWRRAASCSVWSRTRPTGSAKAS